MAHGYAWPESQLDALPRQGEGAGYDRLRGDDGRGSGENKKRIQGPARGEAEKEVVRLAGIGEEVGSLADIVEEEGGIDEVEPGPAYGVAPEVAQVGVEHLGPRHREEDRAQDAEAELPVAAQEADRLEGIEGGEDARRGHDGTQAKDAHDDEPDHDDGAEDPAHLRRALGLRGKEGDENEDGQGHDVGNEIGGDELEPLDRREDRHRRCYHAVAVQESRPYDAQEGDEGLALDTALGQVARDQADKGQYAALSPIVRAQDDEEILDADDQAQGPDEEGYYPHGVVSFRRDSVQGGEAFAKRVQRGGANVAEDDANRAHSQGELMAPAFVLDHAVQ